MDEVSERKFVTTELDKDLFVRLQAVVPRIARRLQLPVKKARSTVIRLALAQYLDTIEGEQKPAA